MTISGEVYYIKTILFEYRNLVLGHIFVLGCQEKSATRRLVINFRFYDVVDDALALCYRSKWSDKADLVFEGLRSSELISLNVRSELSCHKLYTHCTTPPILFRMRVYPLFCRLNPHTKVIFMLNLIL